jgi:hypothetical protein
VDDVARMTDASHWVHRAEVSLVSFREVAGLDRSWGEGIDGDSEGAELDGGACDRLRRVLSIAAK